MAGNFVRIEEFPIGKLQESKGKALTDDKDDTDKIELFKVQGLDARVYRFMSVLVHKLGKDLLSKKQKDGSCLTTHVIMNSDMPVNEFYIHAVVIDKLKFRE